MAVKDETQVRAFASLKPKVAPLPPPPPAAVQPDDLEPLPLIIYAHEHVFLKPLLPVVAPSGRVCCPSDCQMVVHLFSPNWLHLRIVDLFSRHSWTMTRPVLMCDNELIRAKAFCCLFAEDRQSLLCLRGHLGWPLGSAVWTQKRI